MKTFKEFLSEGRGGWNKKWEQEHLDKISDMIKDNKSNKEIARHFDTSVATIQGVLRTRMPSEKRRSPTATVWTGDNMTKLQNVYNRHDGKVIKMMYDDELNDHDPRSIRGAVDRNRWTVLEPNRREYIKERDKKLVKLRETGMKVSQISAKEGIKPSSLHRIIIRNKPNLTQKYDVTGIKPEKMADVLSMRTKGYSLRQIGTKHDKKMETLKKILRKYRRDPDNWAKENEAKLNFDEKRPEIIKDRKDHNLKISEIIKNRKVKQSVIQYVLARHELSWKDEKEKIPEIKITDNHTQIEPKLKVFRKHMNLTNPKFVDYDTMNSIINMKNKGFLRPEIAIKHDMDERRVTRTLGKYKKDPEKWTQENEKALQTHKKHLEIVRDAKVDKLGTVALSAKHNVPYNYVQSLLRTHKIGNKDAIRLKPNGSNNKESKETKT